ncbi:hypothetical protein COF68_05245 [Bacillus toyonensis]|uniref:hypothetical protein n=1 Tax=Bacillus toyonensis TaxID=155322 RepID=UPI000BFD35C1|nr:hypothetical protein [Bacillus toyonensis]PHE64249.1 hypothetical protein COF68_05245 [Bacillus toyonensis]
MNEREAIALELASVREQGQLDREMYLESRKYNQTRQEELLNRLRELDERDIKLKREEKIEKLREEGFIVTDSGKEIPQPKSVDLSATQLQVERVESKKDKVIVKEKTNRVGRGKVVKVPYNDIVSFMEGLLRDRDPIDKVELRQLTEEYFGTKWANFSGLLVKLLDMSNHLDVDKTNRRRHLFYYKEN